MLVRDERRPAHLEVPTTDLVLRDELGKQRRALLALGGEATWPLSRGGKTRLHGLQSASRLELALEGPELMNRPLRNDCRRSCTDSLSAHRAHRCLLRRPGPPTDSRGVTVRSDLPMPIRAPSFPRRSRHQAVSLRGRAAPAEARRRRVRRTEIAMTAPVPGRSPQTSRPSRRTGAVRL
jgi:hypothetical protein